jgi:hypothetical protein
MKHNKKGDEGIEVGINLFIWLVLSIFCFTIWKAYSLIENKDINTILLVGLYVIIGLFSLIKFGSSMGETNLFSENKALRLLWQLSGVLLVISPVVYFRAMPFLSTIFFVLTVIGVSFKIIHFFAHSKKSRKKAKQS